jgi:hypothetical protein
MGTLSRHAVFCAAVATALAFTAAAAPQNGAKDQSDKNAQASSTAAVAPDDAAAVGMRIQGLVMSAKFVPGTTVTLKAPGGATQFKLVVESNVKKITLTNAETGASLGEWKLQKGASDKEVLKVTDTVLDGMQLTAATLGASANKSGPKFQDPQAKNTSQ